MEQYYLGFDAGTQSVKTAVYDIDMNLIVQDTNEIGRASCRERV